MSQSEPEIETKFLEGEKILCFHGPLIYEAKIQKVEVKDGQTKYFIHYMGWNKNWDEWVSPFLHVSTIMLFSEYFYSLLRTSYRYFFKSSQKVIFLILITITPHLIVKALHWTTQLLLYLIPLYRAL